MEMMDIYLSAAKMALFIGKPNNLSYTMRKNEEISRYAFTTG